METAYLALMAGVAFAIVTSLFEVMKSISGKAKWEQDSQPQVIVERRTQNLPYVGVERRKTKVVEVDEAAVEKRRKVA